MGLLASVHDRRTVWVIILDNYCNMNLPLLIKKSFLFYTQFVEAVYACIHSFQLIIVLFPSVQSLYFRDPFPEDLV